MPPAFVPTKTARGRTPRAGKTECKILFGHFAGNLLDCGHGCGGPVGLETLAAALGEESVTLEDICEPYLMQMGMLTRTPRGRCVTRLAYEHLHMAVPKRFAF